MPKTYNDVAAEYDQFKQRFPDEPIDITAFAQQMDAAAGTPGERGQAYTTGILKKTNAFVDKAFEYTGLPEVGGLAGELVGTGFDALAGTKIAPTLESVGRELPRGIVEGALTIPLAASGAGTPAAAAIWANRLGRVAGYGSAALKGYAETDSPIGAAINAGSLGLGNKLLLPATHGGWDIGGKAGTKVGEMVQRIIPDIDPAAGANVLTPKPGLSPLTGLQRTLPVVGEVGAQVGATGALNEATRQAQMSVGPNAVGLTDPSRNPLTQENIAASVAGVIPFAPQAITALVERPIFKSRQLEQLAGWLKSRGEAEKSYFGYEWQGPIDPQTYHDMFGTNDGSPAFRGQDLVPPEEYWTPENLGYSLKGSKKDLTNSQIDKAGFALTAQLDAYRQQKAEGQMDLANMTAQSIKNILEMAQSHSLEAVGNTMRALDVSVRTNPATDVPGFQKFVQELNGLIDMVNDNTNEFDATQKNEKTRGKSWHENARSSELVGQLQNKGLLPKFTEEWFKTEFDAKFSETGDPEFAKDVVLQKAANKVFDAIPDALKAYKALPPPDASLPGKAQERQNAVKNEDLAFFDAFSRIPEEVRQEVVARTREIYQRPDAYINGLPANRLVSWQKAIVRAMESYDPESRTILLRRPKKGPKGERTEAYERVPIKELVQRDDQGEYMYNPGLGTVPLGRGGKGKTRQRTGWDEEGKPIYKENVEENIEGLKNLEGPDPYEALDEEMFKSSMGEVGTNRGPDVLRGEGELPTKIGGGTSGETSLPEGLLGVEEPTFGKTGVESQLGKTLAEKGKSLSESVKKLNDDQLWALGKEVFESKTTTGMVRRDATVDAKRPFFRKALLAALEDLQNKGAAIGPAGLDFINSLKASGKSLPWPSEKKQLSQAMRDYFKSGAPFGDGKSDVPPHLLRIGKVLENVLDPKRLKDVVNLSGKFQDVRDNADKMQVMVPDSKPGQFAPEVLRQFRGKFRDYLGEQGYAGSVRELYTEMAVALAQTMDKIPVAFGELKGSKGVGGLAAASQVSGKGLILEKMALSPTAGTRQMTWLLSTLAHEISHIDSYVRQDVIRAPDAFSKQRRKHLQNLHDLAERMTDDERQSILLTLQDGLIPKEYQNLIRQEKAGGAIYGSHSGEEFVSATNELIFASLLRGKDKSIKTALQTLDFSPTEIREYAQGTYRSIRDVLQGMKDSITHPTVREFLGKEELPLKNDGERLVMSEVFHAVVNAAREGSLLRDGDKALAQARAFIATTSPGAGTSPPLVDFQLFDETTIQLAQDFRDAGVTADVRFSPTASEGLKTAGEFLFRRGDESTRPNVWARWFYPFANLMFSMERAGIPLARPVWNLAEGLQTGISRLRSGMLHPFLKRGADGQLHYDQDHVLLQKISKEKTGPWRKAVDEVSAWQQGKQVDAQGKATTAQPMFVEKDGVVVINDQVSGAKERWEAISSRLSAEDRQVVQAATVALDKVGQNAAAMMTKVIQESNTNRTAALLMVMNKGMTYDKALTVANQVIEGYMKGDVLSVQRTGLSADQLGQVDQLLGGPEGLIGKFKEVTDKLLNRPGFRTESLPGDYVIRFQTPEGETKFLSADTEHKARLLARKLVNEGNTIAGEIVRKDQLRDYADFDAPDTLLQKFVEVEGGVWDRFVSKMKEKHGDQIGAELEEYSPGARTMRELGTKGLNKYLTERESKVDRTRYDYIDGTMSWVGRLAATMQYRLTNMQKDLILADPRGKSYPSFKEMVNDHFDNLMTPTSQLSKELKSFTTAYMMGGSFSSAIVEASQGATTLVPVLINMDKTGGPVKAWARFGKGIADATWVSTGNDWQRIAREVKGKDPKTLTKQEAMAEAYQKVVEDGGINHGVIEDLVYGRDQKMLTAAKFGHGDYGPVNKWEMVRDKVYMGSQLMMKLYSFMSVFNNKISFLAGVSQGFDQGLRGEALYDHAKLVKTLSTFGGGKANVPGLVPKLSTPYTRSAVGLVNALQQYGYGIVATYSQLAKDSLGRSPGLSAQERRQAQKAFGTMLVTQVALGGAMGLPFAAAALTGLEKVFGVPANQAVREGLASLGGDDEQGAMIAETALNGIGNQMFGLDVSSRLGVSSLLGTSSYRGFNLADMGGPAVSLIQNLMDGANAFAQGQPVKVLKALVPNAFKNVVELSDTKAKYGDYGIRDSGDNLLYTPTPSQAAMYMVGFRPRELSQKRQAQKLLTFANERSANQRDRVYDSAANALLQGDSGKATLLANNLRMADPTIDAQSVMRQIVQRGVDSVTEKDLLASGSTANEQERASIAGTFGQGVVTRQSEVQRAMLGAKLGAQLGLQPDMKSFQKAALVDMLVRPSEKYPKGMPRSQAVRLAEFVQ